MSVWSRFLENSEATIEEALSPGGKAGASRPEARGGSGRRHVSLDNVEWVTSVVGQPRTGFLAHALPRHAGTPKRLPPHEVPGVLGAHSSGLSPGLAVRMTRTHMDKAGILVAVSKQDQTDREWQPGPCQGKPRGSLESR